MPYLVGTVDRRHPYIFNVVTRSRSTTWDHGKERGMIVGRNRSYIGPALQSMVARSGHGALHRPLVHYNTVDMKAPRAPAGGGGGGGGDGGDGGAMGLGGERGSLMRSTASADGSGETKEETALVAYTRQLQEISQHRPWIANSDKAPLFWIALRQRCVDEGILDEDMNTPVSEARPTITLANCLHLREEVEFEDKEGDAEDQAIAAAKGKKVATPVVKVSDAPHVYPSSVTDEIEAAKLSYSPDMIRIAISKTRETLLTLSELQGVSAERMAVLCPPTPVREETHTPEGKGEGGGGGESDGDEEGESKEEKRPEEKKKPKKTQPVPDDYPVDPSDVMNEDEVAHYANLLGGLQIGEASASAPIRSSSVAAAAAAAVRPVRQHSSAGVGGEGKRSSPPTLSGESVSAASLPRPAPVPAAASPSPRRAATLMGPPTRAASTPKRPSLAIATSPAPHGTGERKTPRAPQAPSPSPSPPPPSAASVSVRAPSIGAALEMADKWALPRTGTSTDASKKRTLSSGSPMPSSSSPTVDYGEGGGGGGEIESPKRQRTAMPVAETDPDAFDY